MNKLLLSTLTIFCLASYSSELIKFEGKIKNSKLNKLNGKVCSLDLEKIEAQGAQTIAFKAYPKIKGLHHIINKKRAPLKKMNINDLQARFDTHTENKDHVLVGMGSKYRREVSQRLYVEFNQNMDQVISWKYRDGTQTGFGYTYICE